MQDYMREIISMHKLGNNILKNGFLLIIALYNQNINIS